MYLAMETVLNYLIKRGTLTISSMERGLFIYKQLDKRVKLNSDIISLNYMGESPFSENETSIISIIDNTNLYLWFYRGQKEKRYIPEALLLFRKLLSEKYDNSICIFQGSINRVVVIKGGVMVASFVKRNFQQNDTILIKDEYFIENVVYFSNEDYQDYMENSLKYLKYSDLLGVLNLEFDLRSSFNTLIRWVALPSLVSVISILLILVGYDFYMKGQNEKLREIYRSGTKSTLKLKEGIDRNEQLNETYKSIWKEFKYIDKSIAISTIIKTAQDLNVTLDFIRVSDGNVDFVIKTKQDTKIPLYTQKLFQTGKFSDIKNISSNKIRQRRVSITKATMQAKLKIRQ
jgi:hypothetical protein